jgi:LacI family transcriptional regulator
MNIKLIAQEAGVSTATVSYVLNNTGNVSEKTRKRVMEVVEKYNYSPNLIAQSLRANRTNTIGVLVEDITAFQVPSIISGINHFADINGYRIVLSNLGLAERTKDQLEESDKCNSSIQESANLLLNMKVDGIIYIAMHNRKIQSISNDLEIPVVYAYCYTDRDDDISIVYENQNVSYDVTKYLISRGHKKIALISGPINSLPGHKRMLGYETALMEFGLELRPEYVKIGDWKFEFGFKAGEELFQMEDRPTAIFAMNDIMALGVLDAARKNNIKVPEELSIIGFDNRESSQYSYPRLTTVDLPLNEIGFSSAQMIDKKIKGEPVKKSLNALPCKIIVRDSVQDMT